MLFPRAISEETCRRRASAIVGRRRRGAGYSARHADSTRSVATSESYPIGEASASLWRFGFSSQAHRSGYGRERSGSVWTGCAVELCAGLSVDIHQNRPPAIGDRSVSFFAASTTRTCHIRLSNERNDGNGDRDIPSGIPPPSSIACGTGTRTEEGTADDIA